MVKDSGSSGKFVTVVLPWLAAVAVGVLYLATLNHWVSFGNMSTVARASGWLWQPQLTSPLSYLVTYPFRWLPVTWVPVALNLFATVCAVLTLMLLARSVALLPHDRTDDQRKRETSAFGTLSIRSAWVPPLLAVLICGLQLTFWERATNATAETYDGSFEMFDLLIFAYVIRCLLEFRIDERQSWLSRAAFLFGASLTENWIFVLLFPVFVVALIWEKRLEFFNWRFLSRAVVCGLVGLLFYFLLPLIHSAASVGSVPFWEGLKANLAAEKMFLFNFPKKYIWLMSLTSLLPLLVMSIRWPSYFGDPSPLGVALTTLILRVVHGVLLLACLWVMFDPAFSPRHVGLGFQFLPFYYLSALAGGYLIGYFLLVFGARPVRGRDRTMSPLGGLASGVVTFAVWILIFLVPVGLVYKNLPQIRVTNGPMVQQYASLLTEKLPDHAVVLSDDPRRLILAEAALARSGRTGDCMMLDTASLPLPQYHLFLAERYGKRWPEQTDAKLKRPYNAIQLINLLVNLSDRSSLYYLHPSFGYYFEAFYQKPLGLVYELKRYPTNSILSPPLTESHIVENNSFWAAVEKRAFPKLLEAIQPVSAGTNSTFRRSFMDALQIPNVGNATAEFLGSDYSRSLDFWGVELQKAGKLQSAGDYFSLARMLNPDNAVATVNLSFNKNLLAGRKAGVGLPKNIEDEFGKYRRWDEIMGQDGPFDEPNFCLRQARLYVNNGFFRQAAQLFARVASLQPDNLYAHLGLAQMYVLNRMPQQGLALVNEIRDKPNVFELNSTNRADLLVIEAAALFSEKEREKAEQLVHSAIQSNPDNQYLLNNVLQVSSAFRSYSNALAANERLLRLDPKNTGALVNKGYFCIQLSDFSSAIQPLTYALELQPSNYVARLDRAIAYLRTDQLDESRKDYQELAKVFPDQVQVNYGLGEIAYRKKDTNDAIKYYKLYLSNAVPNTVEAREVSERLQELRSGSP